MARIRSHPLYELWYPQVVILQDNDAAIKHLDDIYPDIPKEGDTVGISITLTHTNNIRLVSICHGESVYTFDIKLMGAFPPRLRGLLEDEDVVKIGRGIINITWCLYHEHGIKLVMGGEISRLHRISDASNRNIGEPFNNPVLLSAIAERWLDKTIDNDYIQCRWVDKFELVHYKQASAVAGVVGQSYHAIRESNPVDSVANKYWIFTSVEHATGTVLGRCEQFPLHSLADGSCIEPLRMATDRIRATLTEADLHAQRIGIQTNVERQYRHIVRLCEDIERAVHTYDHSVEEAHEQ
ncbi:hypothetical protein PC9H_009107 [Pleurotus ostreatus]|uniref:Uncharacterized protein n=1 Tax=Pleurotus ostreatus TaxID=5322 RepID=A0A8H7DS91_PLEOS|nr:uncharacterized protein PC9H_009107 [Pleurotus ostreatus]KAF7426738.1 hypothetical protein PC9H_009107 [Pleurotus ostreatus]KAJ8694344.1 hypothetical protein PTI98_009268 [Pleurotus ostreatus]